MYALIERENQGKVAVATTDIRAGSVIIDETPIFSAVLPAHRLDAAVISAANLIKFLSQFNNLDDDKKARVLDLARPGHNPVVETTLLYFAESEEWRAALPLLSKTCNIFTLQAYPIADDVVGVFEQVAKLQHSCSSNCVREFEDGRLRCRAIKNISAGEDLTFICMEKNVNAPTHVLRSQFMALKGFTCHCPRCDAVGDDTRQFNCFDAHCQGSHLVCQPINRDPVPSGYAYDGVEYVEPHLLPCTVCQRSPPLAYQTTMFELEQGLTTEIACLGRQVEQASPLQLLPPMEKTLVLQIPRGHVLNVSAANVRRDGFQRLRCETTQRPPHDLMQKCAVANRHCALILEALLPGAATERAAHFWTCAIVRTEDNPPDREKEVLFKPLRMNLILRGRENRESWSMPWDVSVQKWHLKNLPPSCPAAPDTQVCGFCEESPERAAMKRSRCGVCKKVMYCSRSCQKAHWVAHKILCCNEVDKIDVLYAGPM
jgi:hypothetical protein